jgi:hypothetical protein
MTRPTPDGDGGTRGVWFGLDGDNMHYVVPVFGAEGWHVALCDGMVPHDEGVYSGGESRCPDCLTRLADRRLRARLAEGKRPPWPMT